MNLFASEVTRLQQADALQEEKLFPPIKRWETRVAVGPCEDHRGKSLESTCGTGEAIGATPELYVSES